MTAVPRSALPLSITTMNTFGRIFRVSLFGESHGPAIGALIDGCPAGLCLSAADFEADLARRRPGAPGTTARREQDALRLLSGVFEGRTTGAPILVAIANGDIDSCTYAALCDLPRPGHADLPAHYKFGGFRDPRGGGTASGRLTAALVAAGIVAKRALAVAFAQPILCSARLVEVGGTAQIEARIARAMQQGDALGGLIEGRIEQLPIGLGEPFFDTVEGLLAHALFAIPGVKGIEFGIGFEFARRTGAECRDAILSADGTTLRNVSGGIDGGLSNANPVIFRLAVKPAVSFGALDTVNLKTGARQVVQPGGRHDACFARRLPVVVEAVCAAVILDLLRIAGRIGEVMPQQAVDPRA